MTSISKNVYIDELDGIVTKYKNTDHSIIKINCFDVNLSTYIGFNKDNNTKNPKFWVGDHVRITKYEKYFSKVYVPNCLEEFFVTKNVTNTVL